MFQWWRDVLSLSIAIMLGCTSSQAAPEVREVLSCTVSAWSTDKDRDGLNVRAGPSADHDVIGRLPPPLTVGNEVFAVEVEITGSHGGWFRIERAILNNYTSDDPPKVVFESTGWVSGRHLGLMLNRNELRTGPSQDSPIVATLARDGNGPDSFLVNRLHACRGDWVEIEGKFLGVRLRGWTNGTCSNQVTTCP